jgi:hypothetical protein
LEKNERRNIDMNVDEINKYNSIIYYIIIILLIIIVSLVSIPFLIFDPIENRLFIIVDFSLITTVAVIVLLFVKRKTGKVKLEKDHIQLPYSIEYHNIFKSNIKKNLVVKFNDIYKIEFRESRIFFHLKNGVKIRTLGLNVPDEFYEKEEIKSMIKEGRRKNHWARADNKFAKFVLRVIGHRINL